LNLINKLYNETKNKIPNPQKFINAIEKCDLKFLRVRRNSITSKMKYKTTSLIDSDSEVNNEINNLNENNNSNNDNNNNNNNENKYKYICDLESDDMVSTDSDLEKPEFDILRDCPTWQALKVS